MMGSNFTTRANAEAEHNPALRLLRQSSLSGGAPGAALCAVMLRILTCRDAALINLRADFGDVLPLPCLSQCLGPSPRLPFPESQLCSLDHEVVNSAGAGIIGICTTSRLAERPRGLLQAACRGSSAVP
jgi:hypothetical protein